MQEYIARFQRLAGGATTTVASFVRIHVWVVLALLATGVVLDGRPPTTAGSGYNAVIGAEEARVVSLERNDPQGFVADEASATTFDIAWVGGSSLQSIGEGYYEFLPDLARIELGTVDDRPVDTDIYFLSGMRLFDEYAAILAAIDRKPDLIVVTLNPLWVLNDRAIQSWDNLDGRTAAALTTRPEAWGLGAQMLAPTDLAWGLLGSRIPPLEQRFAYAPTARDLIGDLNFLDDPAPSADPGQPSELEEIQAMQTPLEFWLRYRYDPPEDQSLVGRQAAFLGQSDVDGSGANDEILALIGKALSDSGIPTFVYLAPVDPAALDSEEIDGALLAIEGALEDLAHHFAGPNISYNPTSLARSIPPLEFNDLVHVGQAEEVGVLLAFEICSFLSTIGHDVNCEE